MTHHSRRNPTFEWHGELPKSFSVKPVGGYEALA